jgi:hypothetical protein
LIVLVVEEISILILIHVELRWLVILNAELLHLLDHLLFLRLLKLLKLFFLLLFFSQLLVHLNLSKLIENVLVVQQCVCELFFKNFGLQKPGNPLLNTGYFQKLMH